MSEIDAYLDELDALLRVSRRARRRLVSESREHLVDASAVHGEAEAVRRFGTAADLAASVHTELARRRGLGATLATAVGVLAIGLSTLVLVNRADPEAQAVAVWAVIFFASAQAAAACLVLATLQAVALRGRSSEPGDIALLCRRNGLALGFAALTLVAAGGAVSGQASAVPLVAGPAVGLLALLAVRRARRMVRATGQTRRRVVRDPLDDLATLTHLRFPGAGPGVVAAALIVAASITAFAWDHLDQGSLSTSMDAAAIEAGLAMLGLASLGPALGLRASTRRR